MYTFIGIDPGIVDTALLGIHLDPKQSQWSVRGRVWSNITSKEGMTLSVDHYALDEIAEEVLNFQDTPGTVVTFIEGFRQRGRNTNQDQQMLFLIQEIKRVTSPSKVIDNTGIKKIVTEPLLKLFQCSRFPGTNHADLKSAARVALAGAIREKNKPEFNTVIADFVSDMTRGVTWELTSMSIG